MFGHSTERPFCIGLLIYFLTSLLSVCLSDSSLAVGSGQDANTAPQKLLILDARSYTAAVANRAKGGGCECEGKQQSLSPHTRGVHTEDTSPVWKHVGAQLCCESLAAMLR